MSSIYSPGDIVGGRYRITSALSQGGMGAVYLAQQISLARDVALKVMLERGEDPELTKRFDVEARAVCMLKHPNIITYHDYGRDESGHPFLVMEFLPGYPGTKLVYGDRKASLRDMVHVVAQMCSALHEAHQKGIVHRDLKWSNIMICPQSHDPFFAKLIDFGIMKVATDGSSGDQRQLTVTGMLLGTPEYMSPEAICGMPIDGRADQYSLAVMLWEALEGERPFQGATQFELLRQQVQEEPPAFEACKSLVAGYPALEGVVRQALEKHPDDRFQSILELRDSLLAAVGLGTSNTSPSQPLVTPRRATGQVETKRAAQPIPKSQRMAGAPAQIDTAHRTARQALPAGESAPKSNRVLMIVAAIVLLVAGAAVAVLVTVAGGHKDETVPPTSVASSTPDASTTEDTAQVAAATVPAATTSAPPETASQAALRPVEAADVAVALAPETVALADTEAAVPDTELPDVPSSPADTIVSVADAAPVADAVVKPVGEGTISIQASPWANVTVDGRPAGRAPLTLKHKAGNATIVFSNDYVKPKRLVVKVKANETVRAFMQMSE